MKPSDNHSAPRPTFTARYFSEDGTLIATAHFYADDLRQARVKAMARAEFTHPVDYVQTTKDTTAPVAQEIEPSRCSTGKPGHAMIEGTCFECLSEASEARAAAEDERRAVSLCGHGGLFSFLSLCPECSPLA